MLGLGLDSVGLGPCLGLALCGLVNIPGYQKRKLGVLYKSWGVTVTFLGGCKNSLKLGIYYAHLSTVGDGAFPVAATHLWNSLPSHVTAAPSLSLSIFCCRLKSHLAFLSRFVTHLYSARAVSRHFGHYDRYYI